VFGHALDYVGIKRLRIRSVANPQRLDRWLGTAREKRGSRSNQAEPGQNPGIQKPSPLVAPTPEINGYTLPRKARRPHMLHPRRSRRSSFMSFWSLPSSRQTPARAQSEIGDLRFPFSILTGGEKKLTIGVLQADSTRGRQTALLGVI